jgi:hypothetical protein
MQQLYKHLDYSGHYLVKIQILNTTKMIHVSEYYISFSESQ